MERLCVSRADTDSGACETTSKGILPKGGRVCETWRPKWGLGLGVHMSASRFLGTHGKSKFSQTHCHSYTSSWDFPTKRGSNVQDQGVL